MRNYQMWFLATVIMFAADKAITGYFLAALCCLSLYYESRDAS